MLRAALFGLMMIGLMGFGFVTWRATHHPPRPPQPHIAAASPAPRIVSTSILSAAHDLAPGSFLKAGDLASHRLADSSVPAGDMADTPQQRTAVLGSLIRHLIPAGQPVTQKDLLLPGDHGFLATLLPAGMRAFTIAQDGITSAPGLIAPGDHLDLILVDTDSGASATESRGLVAETVLSDVPVLAVDQQLVQGTPPEPAKHTGFSALTVEVSSIGAERLALALRIGKLALVVRPGAAKASPDNIVSAQAGPAPPTAVWSGDVMPSLQSPTDGSGSVKTVHVFEGDNSVDYHF